MKRIIVSIAIGALLSGCGGVTNGNSFAPVQKVGNTLQGSKIQLAVGTAKLPDGATGLNVVTTFRQSNGYSAALVNTPSIAGPSGFVVPPSTLPAGGRGGSGSDAGTNAITALAQSPLPLPSPASQPTFGVVGGDFASGLGDFNNATNGNSAFYPGRASGPSPAWGLPFYTATVPTSGASAVAPRAYIIGPPAVPFFNDGTYPGGFAGYMTGFTTFEAAPVAGTYTLTDVVATSNAGNPTFTAQASIANLTPLPALPTPTFTPDGNGGGTATIAVPADPRITETIVYVEDTTSGLHFASAPISGTGTLTFTLPYNLGTCVTFVANCENTSTKDSHGNPTFGKSISSGDTYLVYAASFDYPQFEAEPPGNLSQTPALTGAAGQADVTMSPILSKTY